MTATIITNTSNDNNTTNTKIGNSINSSHPSTSVACDDNGIILFKLSWYYIFFNVSSICIYSLVL